MKAQTIRNIINRKLIGKNSEIYGECNISLFGGGTGTTHKTMLLDKVVEKGETVLFEGYTINDGQHTVMNINDIDTLEGMPWHKFALAYGLIKK
tara:strand:- start:1008 stop:1289 length:282 start_codon:yes stop_codon:yes gene_type:complete